MLPIESVAERLGLHVERHRALCPYHDDHNPSLSFSVSRNSFRCFSCGAHGGVIDLAMKVLGKGFADACAWLAGNNNINNIIIEKKEKIDFFDISKYSKIFEYPFLNKKSTEFLFEERKLNPRVIEWCRLSSYRDTLQIPYFDINGRLIGVQYRNLGTQGPRFHFPQGSQCHIYNLPILRHLVPGDDLYIAEGCSDCWSLMSAGHKAIAIPSATLLNNRDLEFLSTTLISQPSTSLHMYPDQDAPGEALYQRLTAVTPITRHSLPSDCKDYSAYYMKYLWK